MFSAEKRVETLDSRHSNPVTRGLVGFAENWKWSSALGYVMGGMGVVEVESSWTTARRDHAAAEPRSQKRDRGT